MTSTLRSFGVWCLAAPLGGNRWQGLSCEPQMGCGEKMPLKETFDGKSVEALTESEIQQITLWVEQGAKDN